MLIGAITNHFTDISDNLKAELNQANRTINLLETHHTRPVRYLFINPIAKDDYKRITSPYGYRELVNPFTGGETKKAHEGIDIAGTWHARVLSVSDGEVIDKWYVPNKYRDGHPVFGGYIRILHDNGMITGYGHLSKIYIHEGDIVKQGQIIGRIGNTGISYGEHLHFSIESPEGFLNPLKYIEIIR